MLAFKHEDPDSVQNCVEKPGVEEHNPKTEEQERTNAGAYNQPAQPNWGTPGQTRSRIFVSFLVAVM